MDFVSGSGNQHDPTVAQVLVAQGEDLRRPDGQRAQGCLSLPTLRDKPGRLTSGVVDHASRVACTRSTGSR